MRMSAITSALLGSLFALTACGSSNNDMDAERFDTLQKCYDEHTQTENMPVQQAVVVCCIDHPIGTSDDNATHPSCGQSAADCTTHVTAELPGLSSADVNAACQSYVQNLAE